MADKKKNPLGGSRGNRINKMAMRDYGATQQQRNQSAMGRNYQTPISQFYSGPSRRWGNNG